MKTPSKKGMADAVYKKSVAPSRQVLPDEILKSNDLLSILDQTSRRLGNLQKHATFINPLWFQT